MGGGDFGSNGSVHWSVRNTGAGAPVRGVDPVNYNEIGNEGGHLGSFRVTLRFANGDAAREALRNVQISASGIMIILVPKDASERPNPDPPEVKVSW